MVTIWEGVWGDSRLGMTFILHFFSQLNYIPTITYAPPILPGVNPKK